jgi:hypothetical protein
MQVQLLSVNTPCDTRGTPELCRSVRTTRHVKSVQARVRSQHRHRFSQVAFRKSSTDPRRCTISSSTTIGRSHRSMCSTSSTIRRHTVSTSSAWTRSSSGQCIKRRRPCRCVSAENHRSANATINDNNYRNTRIRVLNTDRGRSILELSVASVAGNLRRARRRRREWALIVQWSTHPSRWRVRIARGRLHQHQKKLKCNNNRRATRRLAPMIQMSCSIVHFQHCIILFAPHPPRPPHP